MKIERTGRKRKDLKNLMKRGEIWYFKRRVDGRLIFVSLETPDVELAKARRTALALKSVQRKWAEIDGLKAARGMATIGEVCARYEAAECLQIKENTRRDNVWALKRLVAESAGSGDPAYSGARIEDLPVSVLDGKLVRGWQDAKLRAAGADELKRDSAAVSANSMLRQARSVFGRRAMALKIYEGLKLPAVSEFMLHLKLKELKRDNYQKPEDELLRRIWAGAARLRWGSPGAEIIELSTSVVPLGEGKDLVRPAFRGVAEHRWERVWLAFMIASQTGLRKGEIMFMRWHWFGLDAAGCPRVTTYFESDFVPKGKRERAVPVPRSLANDCLALALQVGWGTEPEELVLPGTVTQREAVFRDLAGWMKSLGWTRRQKAHELRKVFASDVVASSSVYAAQHLLGHRELKTTSLYGARPAVAAIDQAVRYS